MKTKILILLLSAGFASCLTTPPADEQKTSLECITENGPAFYANADGQCEWAPALTIPTTASCWKTRLTGPSFGVDAYLLIHRENGAIQGWGKCYSPNATYTGWTTATASNSIVGTFQWDLSPTNAKTLIISNQFNCTITMISNITSNAADYPTSFTATITSSAGSYSHTFTLVAGSGPF